MAFLYLSWISVGEKRLYYGLIVAQKVVYFLVEAFGVNLPYNFYFYHFGPYSDALDWNLQMMKSFGLIDIGSDPQKTGYSIEVNKKTAQESVQMAQKFVDKNRSEIDKVLKLFGTYTPSGLELASTILFVWKNNKDSQTKAQLRGVVVEKVKKLKPKFTQKEIEKQYEYLIKQKLIM